MNLVFCKRSGNKDDDDGKKRKKTTHTHTECTKKRGNLITLVFLIRLIQSWNRNEKPFSSAHVSIRYELKRTGMIFAEVRLTMFYTYIYTRTQYKIYIYIYSNPNNLKRKRIFFHQISIQYMQQCSMHNSLSADTPWIFFWMLHFFFLLSVPTLVASACTGAAAASASSCVDLTVKLINNKQCFRSTIFLPPALFWVRFVLCACVCV